jgi:hypothetical protein
MTHIVRVRTRFEREACSNPSVNLALVPPGELVDVILDNLSKGVPVVNARHPAWKLGVPDEGVSSKKLATAGSPVCDLISIAEVELAPVCW